MEPARTTSLVIFAINGHSFALPIDSVERVVRMVELTPLPGAPDAIIGAVNLHGTIVPVASARRRLGMPPEEPNPDSVIIIARTLKLKIGIVADASSGVVEASGRDLVRADEVLPGLRTVDALLRRSDGMVVIHDIDSFLSAEEEDAVLRALRVHGGEGGRHA